MRSPVFQQFLSVWMSRPWTGGAIAALLIISVIAGDIGIPYYAAQALGHLSEVERVKGAESAAWHALQMAGWCALLGLLSGRAAMFILASRQARLVRQLEEAVTASLLPRSAAFFAETFAGALVSQARRYTHAFMVMEDTVLTNMLPMVVRLLSSLLVLAFLLPLVALLTGVWAVLIIGGLIWATVRLQHMSIHESAQESKVTAALADLIGNASTVKTFAGDRAEQERFSKVSSKLESARIRSWTWGEGVHGVQILAQRAFELSVLALSIYLVASGRAELAPVLLAQLYVSRMVGDLYAVPGATRNISRSMADAREMSQIILTPIELSDAEDAVELEVKEGEIHFKQLWFGFAEPPLFQGLELKIPAGQRVGLVGHSGSGKTTLTRLLLRLQDPTRGAVLIDGQDIRGVTGESLRRAVAYVAQDPSLFHRSLKENLAYAKPHSDEETVEDAARRARAHQFIERLEEGYDSLVGERGVKLSGGERQRIAIGRAILKGAPIIVLDEATSALDSVSEQLINQALEELMEGRTTLVIAHRLSTVRHMDRIIVLDQGRLAEDGTHEQLLKIPDGIYADMWTRQVGGVLADE